MLESGAVCVDGDANGYGKKASFLMLKIKEEQK